MGLARHIAETDRFSGDRNQMTDADWSSNSSTFRLNHNNLYRLPEHLSQI